MTGSASEPQERSCSSTRWPRRTGRRNVSAPPARQRAADPPARTRDRAARSGVRRPLPVAGGRRSVPDRGRRDARATPAARHGPVGVHGIRSRQRRSRDRLRRCGYPVHRPGHRGRGTVRTHSPHHRRRRCRPDDHRHVRPVRHLGDVRRLGCGFAAGDQPADDGEARRRGRDPDRRHRRNELVGRSPGSMATLPPSSEPLVVRWVRWSAVGRSPCATDRRRRAGSGRVRW